MPIEIRLLTWTVVLAIFQIAAATIAKRTQDTLAWGMGPRDTPPPTYTGIPGRIERAAKNLQETMPLFAILVIVAHLIGADGKLTRWGVELYFWARVVYIPTYIASIPHTRSLVYTVSIVGIALVLAADLAALM
ncbi:MAPEG family protein [Caballeronia sp. LjRoot34]|uniref:MAPEG family protein n=1 Tax=Caballeronia sp. LjRoot34 TaxID=3342325 RepID=UPI003ED07257